VKVDAVFPHLDAAAYAPHALHAPERRWPETNCYVDLWIEVLHAMGLPPQAMLGFTVTQDFEGDQFTFSKVPLEDLEALYGLQVQELAIYDRAEAHIALQARRGRLCLVEVDSFFLPDTRAVSYRREHGKTTIAVNAIDLDGRRLGYFHNAGYFALEGEDFDGLFDRPGDPLRPFLPYTEFAKLPAKPRLAGLRPMAAELLQRHLLRRPADNPIRAFQAVLPQQAQSLAGGPFEAFHRYAFNTLRQLGANFELLGDHLAWLEPGAFNAIAACGRIADTAKSSQFQLARALSRGRFDGLAQSLDPAAEAYDALFRAWAMPRAA
jgi:hypothetical protein